MCQLKNCLPSKVGCQGYFVVPTHCDSSFCTACSSDCHFPSWNEKYEGLCGCGWCSCVVVTMLWHPPFLRSHRHRNFYLLPAGLSRSLHRQKQNVLIISWHQSLHKNKGTHFAIVTKWGLYLGIRLTYQELWWHHASSAKCWHDQAWHPRPHGCVQPSRIPVQSTETSISM